MSMSARSPVDEQHLHSLRSHVATSDACRIIQYAELTSSGVLVNVDFVLSLPGRGPGDDEQSIARLLQIAENVKSLLEAREKVDAKEKGCLLAIAPGPPHREDHTWPVVLVASNEEILKNAVVRLNAKFLARVTVCEDVMSNLDEGRLTTWVGRIREIGTPGHDKCLLWDVVRKTSYSLTLDISIPPSGGRTVAQLVTLAQSRLERLMPNEALRELQNKGATSPIILIDIRTAVQRSIHGVIPSAIHVNRVFLEFALDPQSPERLPIVDQHKYNLLPIIFDQEGKASSLAAASLHDLGLLQTTDIVGGFDAWKKAGLPTTIDFLDIREIIALLVLYYAADYISRSVA